MLRPATPLCILYFAAFVLLLLSTLSTPIVKAIPLATFKGVNFGAFGYCEPEDKCSGIRIGYTTESIFGNQDSGDFSLPANARHSLSSILIIHPVAALLSLVCFGLSVAAHFHAPGRSPRFLLVLLILSFPTLLVSLLAFLVDILLFFPHMKWGGWIVLGATIIIMACGIVTCAMRRTLVSRKARQKRIADNAEMNGSNYYANRATAGDTLPRAESPPPLSSGNTLVPGAGDKMPDFATFELQQKKSDDRQPLTSSDPSFRGPGHQDGAPAVGMGMAADDGSSRYGAPGRGGPGSMRGGRGRGPPRDQYGNPLPMNGAYGAPPLRNQGSNGSMGSRSNGGGPQYFRGRGGPPPRGGFRGGRGGPPPPGMRGPPPPGWNGPGQGRGGMGPMMAGGMAGGAAMGRGQRGPPPGYDNGYPNGPGREASPGPGGYGAPRHGSPQPVVQPGPIGQAMEMDARQGIPSPVTANYGLRDSDGDVQGMVGLQQQRLAGADERRDSDPSSPSVYSDNNAYVPARANWNRTQSPLNPVMMQNDSSGNISNQSRGLSPIQASPTENHAQLARTSPLSHRRKTSSDYYEDVDPRFDTSHPPPEPNPAVPASLVPGYGPGSAQPRAQPPNDNSGGFLSADGPVDPSSSNEDVNDGSRSPAASEASHYTSISQRGVNPQWRGGHGGYGGPPMPRRNDMMLEGNPDFMVPGGARGGRGGMRGGRGGLDGREPGVIGTAGVGSGAGRYPGGDAF